MEHTPGEWRTGGKGWDATPIIFVPGVVPIEIALLGQDSRITYAQNRANAERIVKAVNSYDAMVEALKSAKEAYDRLFEIGCPQYHVIPLYRDGYRALTKALAEGK
ncbi:hypothetical protein LCGC14_1437030 [marine sediment metagenome]|uniref:Uncharacterized protein n=1 Tax=marine sediment metagenome TaxID=412755 RepID=A0A0F9JMF6_9ZZZZ